MTLWSMRSLSVGRDCCTNMAGVVTLVDQKGEERKWAADGSTRLDMERLNHCTFSSFKFAEGPLAGVEVGAKPLAPGRYLVVVEQGVYGPGVCVCCCCPCVSGARGWLLSVSVCSGGGLGW